MLKEVIASGKDIMEAKENARNALGAGPLDNVEFEIVHAGSKGIFGIIGVKPAKVRATMEIPDKDQKPRQKPERVQKDRPKKEKPQSPAPHNEDKPEQKGCESEVVAAPKQEKVQQKKKKKKKNNKPKTSENKAEKQKSKVIPETELNMTPKLVKDGEDMSFEFIKTLIKDIGLSAEAAIYDVEDGSRRIVIFGEDASTLIGHHGDTLDALQYLANLACVRKNINGERDKSRVTIDIEGYRAKREETLRALARRMSQKALRNKRSVMLEPMSPYERRIIHSEVQNIEGVSTKSIGSDNNRKIVIYLTDKKPQGIFDDDEEDAVSQNEDLSVREQDETEEVSYNMEESLSVEETNDIESVEKIIPDENDMPFSAADEDDIK